MNAGHFSSPLRPDFHHLRAALRAPSAGNRVDEVAARTLHIQGTGECVWLAFPTLFRCLILKDDNHVHGRVPTLGRRPVSSFYRGPVGTAIPILTASHLAKELG